MGAAVEEKRHEVRFNAAVAPTSWPRSRETVESARVVALVVYVLSKNLNSYEKSQLHNQPRGSHPAIIYERHDRLCN